MVDYIRENMQFYLIITLWIIVGIFGGPLIYLVLPLSIVLMKNKGMYEELILGYLVILILSDSLEESLVFAKNVKNIYIVLLSVYYFSDRENFQPINRLYSVYLPFFIFSFFTMLYSLDDPFIGTSLQKTVSFVLSFVVIPNYISKLYREKGEIFFRNIVLFALITLLMGFVLKFTAPSVASLATGRYRGVLGNPNGLGLYCCFIFMIFYISNNFFPSLFSRNMRFSIYLAIAISIYLSDSRNAIISMLIFYLFQRFFSLSPFFGFIIFLAVVFAIEVISNNIKSIVLSLNLGNLFRVNTLDEGGGRYVAWGFAWKQIQHNFFIGKGFAYNEFYMRQHYTELGKMGHQGGIHNSFLTFWMDQGLVGLLIYLFSYLRMFVQAAQKSKFAFPIMFSISFSAFFESWLVGSLSAYAFLAMLIFTIITSEDINEVRTQKSLLLEQKNED